MGKLILVTGPARSGKSEWAETLAAATGKSIIYIATALIDPDDIEWQQRILKHQQRRPPSWETRHIPLELAATIEVSGSHECLLIDSVGTWVANFLEMDDASWNQRQQDLIESLQTTAADAILVAEETGWGVVPAYLSGRLFRDRLGSLVRHLGAIAHPVYLVTAGYAIDLSALGTPLSTSATKG